MSDVLLISLPVASPFTPPMPLLALRSYLQIRGIPVSCIDANAEAMHYVLNPDRCRKYVEPCFGMLERGAAAFGGDAVEQARLLDRGCAPPSLDRQRAEDVLSALERIWTADGYDLSPERYRSDLGAANDALILASARMTPHNLTIWGSQSAPPHRQSTNPYLDYVRDDLVPRIQQAKPGIIGISLTFANQLFYTQFLIHELRQRGVDSLIAVGGAYCTETWRSMNPDGRARLAFGRDLPAIDQLPWLGMILLGIDPVSQRRPDGPDAPIVAVCGEGEKPLVRMAECLDKGEGLLETPNLIYVDPGQTAIMFNEQDRPLAAEDLPRIDLSGFGVGRMYFTPIVAAPMTSSRGCYWNKCTFCGRARSMDSQFRAVPIDVIMDTLESYRENFGVDMLVFCDESMPPAILRRLTERMTQANIHFDYSGMFRFEEALFPLVEPAAKCGLKYVSMGLESGCSRVLDLMNKGIEPKTIEDLLAELDRNDVQTHVFVIFGFPTETAAEAAETLEMLERNVEKIWSIGVTPFYLDQGSYIMSHCEEFGIEAPPDRPIGPNSFVRTVGMSDQEVYDCVARIWRHPELGARRPINGREDYWAISDMLRQRGLWQGSPPEA